MFNYNKLYNYVIRVSDVSVLYLYYTDFKNKFLDALLKMYTIYYEKVQLVTFTVSFMKKFDV